MKISEETRKKISETLKRKGIKPPPGSHLGFKHSPEARLKITLSRIGDKNPSWKGEALGVGSIHSWLRRIFGTPKLCEFCKDTKEFCDWALLKDKKYERKRENFMRLCRSCHMKYDTKYGVIKYVSKNKNIRP